MKIEDQIVHQVSQAITFLYNSETDPSKIGLQQTRKDFEGDFTVVTFPITAVSKKSPEVTGHEIGEYLIQHLPSIASFQVIKGFLNLSLSDTFWKNFFEDEKDNQCYGIKDLKEGRPVVVEFSSPNTNKPLHLGHIRNNLLGDSLSNILIANGLPVFRVNLVNDRGIHICKSMLAWKRWGNGEDPASSGLKGDHLVGKYYVMFDQKYRKEILDLVSKGFNQEEAGKKAALMQEVQEMLRQWERGDEEVVGLWRMMNGWVYQGFDETYKRLGIRFDKTYYESDTYLLGKVMLEEGLSRGILTKKEDGSVWCDLKDCGLEEKLLQRADGTSVYMTQDIGTAALRYKDYDPERMIYVVGNEQNYHFEVLKTILKKLKKEWAEKIHHFSYGMVELPEGKMKSREGTVVDADDLIDEMVRVARQTTEELGKNDTFQEEESQALYQMLALGAIKYFILKVDPKKNMLFNPEESIDFSGNTGPFIQYTHARIRSLLKKADLDPEAKATFQMDYTISDIELRILRILQNFPEVVSEAGSSLSPALVANYVYELAKEYNHFYQSTPVLKAEAEAVIRFRLELSGFVGQVIKTGMQLLGIDVPERM